jgi:hypothetical protein
MNNLIVPLVIATTALSGIAAGASLDVSIPTTCATCTTFCMDEVHHDRVLHPTSSHSKQAPFQMMGLEKVLLSLAIRDKREGEPSGVGLLLLAGSVSPLGRVVQDTEDRGRHHPRVGHS